jgi:hypothetical protein
MSYAHSLRAVRGYFGFRQHELAAWLGLSRVQLSRIEAETDPLPAHARPWLRPWLQALDQGPDPRPDLPLVLVPLAGPAVLLARRAECYYQAEQVRQLLATLAGRACYLRRRLAAGALVQAALPLAEPAAPAHAPTELRRRWLARLLEAAADGLVPLHPTTGALALALLAARRSAWLHEAAWLEAHMESLGAGELGSMYM